MKPKKARLRSFSLELLLRKLGMVLERNSKFFLSFLETQKHDSFHLQFYQLKNPFQTDQNQHYLSRPFYCQSKEFQQEFVFHLNLNVLFLCRLKEQSIKDEEIFLHLKILRTERK